VADAPRPARFVALAPDAQRAVSVVSHGDGRWTVTVDDRTYAVDARRTGPATWSLLLDGVVADAGIVPRGEEWLVEAAGRTHAVRLLDERRLRARGDVADGRGEVRASMPGKVVALHVAVGDVVARGQPLLVLEAMKMENDVVAPRAGTVRKLTVQVGRSVEAGEMLAVIE
jgi:biotin carboxyl carrier protein